MALIDLKVVEQSDMKNHWEMDSKPESDKGIITKTRKGISFVSQGKVSAKINQIY